MKCKKCSYFSRYERLTMSEWRECVSCSLNGTKKNIDEQKRIVEANKDKSK